MCVHSLLVHKHCSLSTSQRHTASTSARCTCVSSWFTSGASESTLTAADGQMAQRNRLSIPPPPPPPPPPPQYITSSSLSSPSSISRLSSSCLPYFLLTCFYFIPIPPSYVFLFLHPPLFPRTPVHSSVSSSSPPLTLFLYPPTLIFTFLFPVSLLFSSTPAPCLLFAKYHIEYTLA